MAARDLFDPTRFSNCCSSVDTGLTNMTKIANREKNSFNKILDKVEKINSSSPFVKKAKELVNVSNRIYENGKIPDKFAQGITGVLDHFGAASILKVVEKVDINAVNNVKTTMGNVSDKLRGGNLRLKDMDGLISDVTRLQKYAKGLFGSKDGGKPNDCVCHPEVYARHIADKFFPKYASLYAVRFHVGNGMSAWIHPTLSEGHGFEFLCSKINRPSVEYDLEEINRYNQRIFVQKKATYSSLTCDFIDDDSNLVHTFAEQMLRYYTPAMSLVAGANNSQILNFPGKTEYDSNAENFITHFDNVASSKGPERGSDLSLDFSPLIEKIEIFHMHKFGQQVTKYNIHHPVLKSINFSELASDSSDIPIISCEFNITNFNIEEFNINDNTEFSWDFSWNRGDDSGTVLGNYDGSINTKATVLAKLQSSNATGKGSKSKSLKDRLKESAKKFAKAVADKVKSWVKNTAKALSDKLFGGPKMTAFADSIKNGIKTVTSLPGKLIGVAEGLVETGINKLDGLTKDISTPKVLSSVVGIGKQLSSGELNGILDSSGYNSSGYSSLGTYDSTFDAYKPNVPFVDPDEPAAVADKPLNDKLPEPGKL